MSTRHLDTLFHPRSIAVIGGSDRVGSLGTHVLANLVQGGFEGSLFAVNPKRVERDGVRWVPGIDALPEVPEIAIVVTPSATVPGVCRELAKQGVKLAVILSSGLHDPTLRAAMLEAAGADLRIIGPNCLGILLPHARVNASFAPRNAAPGSLAFVSQSGALVTAMLDWASAKHVGFSAVISGGDMADVDLADLVDLLAADRQTKAILLYIEGIGDAARFLSAARAAAAIKPVIAIKAGRDPAGAVAATSHSGALTGSYDVHAAAFARAGIVLVDSLTELFDAAQMLACYRPRAGKRLALVSNGGGAGVLAADALPARGGMLATLAPATIESLDIALPAGWSRANPVDVIGDARPERFVAAVDAVLADPGVDALLVIHCPTAVATGTEIAHALIVNIAARDTTKPLIACWMGSANADAVRADFAKAGIPLFDNLDDAVRGFGHLMQAAISQELRMLAPPRARIAPTDQNKARAVISGARLERRAVLTAREAKTVLAAYGIPVPAGRLARTPAAVPQAAAGLPPPYALKLVSPQISHKSDVGGVCLDLASGEDAARAAAQMHAHIRHDHPEASITGFEIETMESHEGSVELLAGMSQDATFGPVIAFGAGGKAVEVIADRALGLPPLDARLAEEMIAATRVSRLLDGYRDVPAVDRAAVVQVLEALSQIAIDFPELAEIEINPLLARADGVIALDARARVQLEPSAPHLAIRPVPVEWTADLATRSGLKLHIRPVVPQDETTLADLFAHVSTEDLRYRFLTGITHVARERLVPMCQVDYARTINFLAFDGDRLVASAMLVSDPDHRRAELALAVHKDYKGKGVSWTLVQHVLRYAAAEKIETVESLESRDNHAALALEREAGFLAIPLKNDPGEVLMRRDVTGR